MARHVVRKIFAVTTVFLVIVAILSVFVWHHFSPRRSLPFALSGEPVIGRRIYSPFSGAASPPANAPRLHDFPIIGEPIPFTPALAAELREILNSPSTYTIYDSECFEPGMAASFGDGANRIDVLICLLCNRAVFYSGNSHVGRCISDEGHKRLSSIYERLFGDTAAAG
jgi:hypothetical protein